MHFKSIRSEWLCRCKKMLQCTWRQSGRVSLNLCIAASGSHTVVEQRALEKKRRKYSSRSHTDIIYRFLATFHWMRVPENESKF